MTMQYRTNPKNGDKLSVLGYGCMRYTRKGGKFDVAKAEREMARGIDLGINYFDTAYTYKGCEELLGSFLAKGYRDKVFIATKLPHYQVKTLEDAKRIFQEELTRLRTDYIDYYLIHILTDIKAFRRLEEIGVMDWLAQLKAEGIIHNLGFSYHGGTQGFINILDAYSWDFTQIQFNYMDEHSQAGRKGLEYANSLGLPVIIMEPLRGGRLTKDLPSKAKEIFNKATPHRSAADWGLRWLWNEPGVTVVLSGMNQLEQVEENCIIATDTPPGSLTTEEISLYQQVKVEIEKATKVPCTGCGYCLPCPRGVDIPNCFRCYNASYADDMYTGMKEYFMVTTLRTDRSNAGLCVDCGKCRLRCPQGIDVPEEIKRVRRRLENPIYKIGAAVAGRVVKF